MILDNETLFANGLAHDGTAEVIDLGVPRPGPGNPIKIFIQGSSDLAACTGFTVTDGATVSAADALVTQVATLAGVLVEFELPSDVARYVTMDLTGTTSAGTWTAGIVLPGNQTNL